MENPVYIRPARIRALARQHGRRVGADFVEVVEAVVSETLHAAMLDWNNGRVTLNGGLAVRCLRQNRILQ